MLARMHHAHLLVEEFPATVDAMADGELTARHAHAIVSEAARAWATGSDERNAAVVRASRGRADLVVEVVE